MFHPTLLFIFERIDNNFNKLCKNIAQSYLLTYLQSSPSKKKQQQNQQNPKLNRYQNSISANQKIIMNHGRRLKKKYLNKVLNLHDLFHKTRKSYLIEIKLLIMTVEVHFDSPRLFLNSDIY